MAILTAYAAFDSRSILGFSASATGLTISWGSSISLANALDATVKAEFTGSFKIPTSSTSLKYGTVKKIDFYKSDGAATPTFDQQYSIATSYTLSKDAQGNFTFPAMSNFAASSLFKGADTYIGSTGNDYLAIYDNRGKDIYYGLEGNDYIQLSTQGGSVAGGGLGKDLIASSAKDRLTGGAGEDYFWLGAQGSTITDFTAAEDNIVLDKGYYEEKILTDWLEGSTSDISVLFTKTETGDFTISADYFVAVEGIKSAREERAVDDYFVYDLGSGKLYFDQDGIGGRAAKVLVTYSSKPQLTAEDLAGSVLFAPHLEGFRDYWLETIFTAAE